MGPFHKIVLDFLITLENWSQAEGPISRPSQPSGILLLGDVDVFALASNLSAIIESDGR
jgi:hypothetical protein